MWVSIRSTCRVFIQTELITGRESECFRMYLVIYRKMALICAVTHVPKEFRQHSVIFIYRCFVVPDLQLETRGLNIDIVGV